MIRTLVTAILLGTLLGGALSAKADEAPALARFDLPLDVQAAYDGAGRLQLSYGEVPLFDLELVLEGGYVDRPATVAEHALGQRSGARVLHPDRVARSLQEGMDGGRRGSGGDDDGDGSFDEDPFDGFDDDGDGAIDEDFAAIGTNMHCSVADLAPLGLDGARLRGELYHWGYYHVDAALFWNARIENDPGLPRVVEGAAAARLTSAHAFEMFSQRIRPHSSVGRYPEMRVTMPRLRVDLDDGSRLYVGVLRLDGLKPSPLEGDGFGVVWPANSGTNWPLAVLVARTEKSLLYLAGQAMLTYDRAGAARDASQYWSVPPLCARCQNPSIERAHAKLSRQGESLRLQVSYRGVAEPDALAHEGFRVGDRPLARWLVASGSSGATYEMPLRSALAQEILSAASSGSLRLQPWLVTGKTVRPGVVEVESDHSLPVVSAPTSREADENDLPSYLSPQLVQSWPNPFRETTTIEVRVPSTLEEAFDLDEDERQRFDLQAAPPFGSQATVSVRVFNVSGQLIRVLEESTRGAGTFSVHWDGNDLSGRAVAAGAYYVNVEMGEWSVTRRVLRLKP